MSQAPPTSPLLPDPMLRGAPVLHGYKVTDPAVLVRKLAEGGMAAVYLGVHLRLRVPVAVKVLKSFPGDGAAHATERFTIEAEQAARLAHQNIVRVYDFRSSPAAGKGGNAVQYLVMEYVDGETVEGRVRRRRRLSGREAATIAMYAARGLRLAHKERVTHRDIKPANILIARDGDVKLADLGIAKAGGTNMPVMTQENTLLGTPQYMAPELWRGARHASAASDVYAMGATIGFMLTGEHLLGGGDLPEIMHRAVLQGFPDLRTMVPAIDPQLCEVVRRATGQDPTQRPTAAELEKLLRQYLDAAGGEQSLEDDNAGGPGGGPPTNLPTAAVITAICRTLDTGERQRAYVPTTIQAGEMETLTRSVQLPLQPAVPQPAVPQPVAQRPSPAAQPRIPVAPPFPAPPAPSAKGPAGFEDLFAGGGGGAAASPLDWPPAAPVGFNPRPPAAPPPVFQPPVQRPPAQKPAGQKPPAPQPAGRSSGPNFGNVNIGAAPQPNPYAGGGGGRVRATVADPRAAAPARRPGAEARVPPNPIRQAHRRPRGGGRGLLLLAAVCLFAGGAFAAYHFNFADVLVQWLGGDAKPAGGPTSRPATRPSTAPARPTTQTSGSPRASKPEAADAAVTAAATVGAAAVVPAVATPDDPAAAAAARRAALTERLYGTWEGRFDDDLAATFAFDRSGSMKLTLGGSDADVATEGVGTWTVDTLHGTDGLVVETRLTLRVGGPADGKPDPGDVVEDVGQWVVTFGSDGRITVHQGGVVRPTQLTRTGP